MKKDYTSGSISRNAWSFAVPMASGTLVTLLYALCETGFAGHLGSDSLAAYGSVVFVYLALNSVPVSIGVAGLAIVSRRTGAGETEEASAMIWQTLYMSIASAILTGGLTAALAQPLTGLLQLNGHVQQEAVILLRAMCAYLVIEAASFVFENALQGTSSPRLAFIATLTGRLVGLALCPVVIFGVGSFEGIGLLGLAVADGIGRIITVLLSFSFLRSKKVRVVLRWSDAAFKWDLAKKLVPIAWPTASMILLRTTSRLVLMPLVATIGTPVLAAYAVALRTLVVPNSIGFGLGTAAGVLAAQNLGAGKPRRAAVSMWLIAAYHVGIMTAAAIGLFIWAPEIVGFLADGDPSVVEHGTAALRIVGPAYVFYGLGTILGRGLQGVGATKSPMWINLVTLWVIELPLAYLLAVAGGLGALGIWIALAAADYGNGTAFAVVVLRGRWKKVKV